MKTNITYCYLFLLLFSFITNTNLNSQIITERLTKNVVITSSAYDYGNYNDFLDNNPLTQWRSAGVNPAFIQFDFEEPELVDSISVFIGQKGGAPAYDMEVWLLEVADNQSDMDNKVNTYQLVIDMQNDTAGVWQSYKLNSPLTKKIWKFTITRTVGDNYVHVPELGLFRKVDVSQINRKYPLQSEISANNIITKASGNKVTTALFDGLLSTFYDLVSDNDFVDVLMVVPNSQKFNKIRIFPKSDCKFSIEYADNYNDLCLRGSSYVRMEAVDAKANQWNTLILTPPIDKKIINVYFLKTKDTLSVAEIEFYKEGLPEPLSGIQSNIELWEGWRWRNTVEYLTYYGIENVPVNKINWSSTDTTIVTVDTLGKLLARKSGIAYIIAKYKDVFCSTAVQVKSSIRKPEKETLSDYLANPSENCIFEMPVLVINYIPTTDGVTKDPAYFPEFFGPDVITIDSTKHRAMKYVNRLKMALEEGSKFRKYKNPTANSSLGIKIVDIINVFEPLPPGLIQRVYSRGILEYSIDYDLIFNQLNVRDYVENKNVKQIWFIQAGMNSTSYCFRPLIHKPENFRSNFESYMSTPTSHKVCNGSNPEPLPIYNKTYTVISIDNMYSDFAPQNFEPFTHQFEWLWMYQNWLHEGSSQYSWGEWRNTPRDFFFEKFVGKIGRCGWTHTPPNTTINYGYFHYIQEDTSKVKPTWCDIEDWKPDSSGEKTLISYHTWEDKVYDWPDGVKDFEGRNELQWFIYWLQSIPGYENNIPYLYKDKNCKMSNWWKFVYDWDKYTETEIGLWEESTEVLEENRNSFVNKNPFPNPVNDYLYFPEMDGKSFEIYSAIGNKVMDTIYLKGIDVRELSAGVYLIKFDNKTYKFIKR